MVAHEEWINRDITDADQIERLLIPNPSEAMTAWPVSTAVNNTRHDNPSLIDPVGDPIDTDTADEESDQHV